MRKNFVLDTNVLLHDPQSIFHFSDNHVVVPIYVLEEIDQFKKELSERGRSAREIARRLDALRGGKTQLSEGVIINERGGVLRVAVGARALPEPLRASQMVDNYILATALEVRDHEPDVSTVLVTKDVNLRIRADALGLLTEDYESDRIENPDAPVVRRTLPTHLVVRGSSRVP